MPNEEENVRNAADEEKSIEDVTAAKEEDAEPIPDELDGLDEKYAREVMREFTLSQKNTEADGESETDNSEAQDTQSEAEKLKTELAEYKKRFGEITDATAKENTEPANEAAKKPEASAQISPAPQESGFFFGDFTLNKDAIENIEKAVKNEALRMTGMTEDDLKTLEYADDDDPKAGVLKYALNVAKSNVLAAIRQASRQKEESTRRILIDHQRSVDAFNAYTAKEMQEKDFADVRKFAVNDFYGSLTDGEQRVISSAWARVERGTASPAEMLLLTNYFSQAKAAYRAKNAPTTSPKKAHVLPKSDGIRGTGAGGGVSAAMLSKMLEEKRFNDIPEKYQNMLLGID